MEIRTDVYSIGHFMKDKNAVGLALQSVGITNYQQTPINNELCRTSFMNPFDARTEALEYLLETMRVVRFSKAEVVVIDDKVETCQGEVVLD